MIDTLAQTVRAHFMFEQDIAQLHRLTLQQKHYNATGAERADLAVALADNRTEQDDLRIAMAIANGYDPAALDRNGFTLGRNWTPVRPTPHEQAMAYATPRILAIEEYDRQDDGPTWAA